MIYKFPPLSTDAFSYIFGRRKRIFSGKKLAAGFTAQQLANIDGNNLFTICNKFLTIVYDSNFIKFEGGNYKFIKDLNIQIQYVMGIRIALGGSPRTLFLCQSDGTKIKVVANSTLSSRGIEDNTTQITSSYLVSNFDDLRRGFFVRENHYLGFGVWNNPSANHTLECFEDGSAVNIPATEAHFNIYLIPS